jgi:hypothetical protein
MDDLLGVHHSAVSGGAAVGGMSGWAAQRGVRVRGAGGGGVRGREAQPDGAQ